MHTYAATTGETQDVDPADFAGEEEGFIYVKAERDGFDSLMAFGTPVFLVERNVLFEDDGEILFEDGTNVRFEN